MPAFLSVPGDHPLVGMLRRRERAVAHANALTAKVEAFKAEHLGRYVTESLPGGRTLIRAELGAQPDPDWGVDLGEIIYNLRCALDYLVYELAVQYHRQDPPPHERDLQFPVYPQGQPFPRDRIRSWVGPDVAEWLESVQSRIGSDFAPLSDFTLISNRDKHRRLALVAVGVIDVELRIVRAQDVEIDEATLPARGAVVVNNEVMGSFRVRETGPNPQWHVEGSFGQDVVFGLGTALSGKAVLPLMDGIYEIVDRMILEAWENFFGEYRRRIEFASRMATVPTVTLSGGCRHWSIVDLSESGVTIVHAGHPGHPSYGVPEVTAEANP